MKDTDNALFDKAITEMMDDMKNREITAILWDNSRAGFHYLPEVTVTGKDGKTGAVRVMGLYIYNDKLYIIEEGKAPVHLTNFYTHGVEVPPVVVTLTEDAALSNLGDPTQHAGYTADATHPEWVTIADCYFEALAEE